MAFRRRGRAGRRSFRGSRARFSRGRSRRRSSSRRSPRLKVGYRM